MITRESESGNGIKVLIKWEFFWIIVQFMVLFTAIIGNYMVTQARLSNVEKILDEHIKAHSAYLRIDTWETRNRFIDSKLDRIEAKLDLLMERRR
jgi:hypothetical protein